MGPMRSMRRLGRIKAALLAVVALLAAGGIVAVMGSSGSGPDTRTSGIGVPEPAPADGRAASRGAGVMPEIGADAASTADAKAGAPGAADPQAALGQPPVPVGPRVVRTADVSLRVGEGSFSRAFDQVTAIATAEGGYVSGSTMSTASAEPVSDGSHGRARAGELTVRVPADRFDSVRRTVAGLGTIEQEQIRGEDVTAQIVDYDARLKSLQAEEEALRALVGRATAVGEVLQVQSQLFQVRQQVETLQAQRDQLDRQATLATIHVSLMEPGAATRPSPEPTGLAHAVERALAGSGAVIGGTIVVLG